jgi:hypothetical protein
VRTEAQQASYDLWCAPLESMDIRGGLWRGGTAEMETVSAVWTSPWMHVEAGMAIASKKPVRAAPECGVTEGAFAQHNWVANVFGSDVENPRSPGVERWAAAGATDPSVESRLSRPVQAVADSFDVTRAEFEYAVTHEGAMTVDDVVDRRTRIGVVQAGVG